MLVKIVSAAFLVVCAIPQQMVGDHEHRMGDRYSGSFGTLLRHTYQHNTTLAEFDYTVDLLGNRTQVTETLREPDDDLQVQTIAYGYDGLSRLLSADYYSGAEVQGTPTHTYAYEYDYAGNRTKKTVDGTPTNYSYNAANQITSGGVTYDGTNGLTWDRADRLLSMGGIDYGCDGLLVRVHRRIARRAVL